MTNQRSYLRGGVSLLLVALLAAPPLPAQPPAAPGALHIVIVEGDGAINNVRQRVAREPIVQVEDENRKPVAGALVTFMLPGSGPGGTFLDGSNVLTVMTDENGRAVARGLRTNTLDGKFEIRVTASHEGRTTSATIGMTNMAVTGALAGAKLWALLAIVGGAAAGGAIYAVRSNGNGGAATRPPTSVTPGTPVVTPPR